MLTENEQLL